MSFSRKRIVRRRFDVVGRENNCLGVLGALGVEKYSDGIDLMDRLVVSARPDR
jgi:hypothetical protein